MKLAQANESARKRAGGPVLQQGDVYHAAGRKYRIVRVLGSTVTAQPIPTVLERVRSLGRAIAAPYRWALRPRVKVGEFKAPLGGGTSRQRRARRSS